MAGAKRSIGAAWLLLATAVLAPPAFAHGVRLPLSAWGGFEPAVLRCQRVVARAAARCAAAAWAARRACREAQLAGGTCDEQATAERIDAARRAALDAVDADCSERQAIALQFLGSFDLQQDLIAYCRGWELAADSAAFGRATASPACRRAAADAASDLLHRLTRTRRRAMDRLAGSPPADPRRPDWLLGATRRTAAVADRVATILAARCPASAAELGRDAAAVVAPLAARADCIGAAFYIQDALLCPAPTCGNFVIELPEECDDGNTISGDGCSDACLSEGDR